MFIIYNLVFPSFFFVKQVKKAFFALVANGVRAAPLWDSEKQSFVGKNLRTKINVPCGFSHVLCYHKRE